jgi:hypothetical protein
MVKSFLDQPIISDDNITTLFNMLKEVKEVKEKDISAILAVVFLSYELVEVVLPLRPRRLWPKQLQTRLLR